MDDSWLPEPTAAMQDGARFEASADVLELHRLALERTARAALRDRAHAALHTGPWREVPAVWREAYMFAALHLAQADRPAASRDAALGLVRTLDLGLMLGSSAFRRELLAAVESIERGGELGGVREEVVEEWGGPWLPGAVAPSGSPMRVLDR
ncbi:hypothetical protein T492DRAFT_898261 [Pavlovales sp. CCMP2436]|nr:hypothetical protein T492DRAFT_898261 [Pavlovales sp. CCMP2436]